MLPILTPRLQLRPLERRDFRALHGMYGDEELMRYIIGRRRTPWETRARLKKDLRHHLEHGFGLCLGEHLVSGEVVGRFGIEPCPTEFGLEGELAWMVRRSFRGQGYATEAARALVEFAIGELELHRVFATTHPENAASIRVMVKVGLVKALETPGALVFEAPASANGPAI